MVSQADYLFHNRHLDTSYFSSALTILAQARTLAPDNETGMALQAAMDIEMGDSATSSEDKFRYYREAECCADTLRSLDSLNPAGHFWWAAACGSTALARGNIYALAALPAVLREFHHSLAVDSSFAVAYGLLGVIYRELPAAIGGDLAKARWYFETGITIDPNLTLLHLELARLEVREHQWAAARAQLSDVMTTDNPSDPAVYFLNDRPEAQKLLDEIRDKQAGRPAALFPLVGRAGFAPALVDRGFGFSLGEQVGDAPEQNLGIERLGEIGVGAQNHPAVDIGVLRQDREHQDRQLRMDRVVADCPADFPAVHPGQHQIEHHQVRLRRPRQVEPGDAVGRRDDLVARDLEPLLDDLDDARVVLDH
jgi:hypothetical protein